jgi:hypothetical protein
MFKDAPDAKWPSKGATARQTTSPAVGTGLDAGCRPPYDMPFLKTGFDQESMAECYKSRPLFLTFLLLTHIKVRVRVVLNANCFWSLCSRYGLQRNGSPAARHPDWPTPIGAGTFGYGFACPGAAGPTNHFATIDHGQCETSRLFHRMHVAWPDCSPVWPIKHGFRMKDDLAGISLSQASGLGRAVIASG